MSSKNLLKKRTKKDSNQSNQKLKLLKRRNSIAAVSKKNNLVADINQNNASVSAFNQLALRSVQKNAVLTKQNEATTLTPLIQKRINKIKQDYQGRIDGAVNSSIRGGLKASMDDELRPLEQRLATLKTNAKLAPIQSKLIDDLPELDNHKQFDDNLAGINETETRIKASISLILQSSNAQSNESKAKIADFNKQLARLELLRADNQILFRKKNIDLLKAKAKDNNLDNDTKEAYNDLIESAQQELNKLNKQFGDLMTKQYGSLNAKQRDEEYDKKLAELNDLLAPKAAAPAWENVKYQGKDEIKQSKQNEADFRREVLLKEAAFLLAQKQDWVANAGGLYSIKQSQIDQHNEQKGLKVESPQELRALFRQLFIVQRFIDGIDIKRDYLKQDNDNDVTPQDTKWSSVIDYSTRFKKKKDKLKKFNKLFKSNVNNISNKGISMMTLSHGGAESTWAGMEIVKAVDAKKKTGVIYIEAPYALNLHPNTTKAINGWIKATGANFPVSTAEVLDYAVSKNWDVVPVDATQVFNGGLDVELLRTTKMPKVDTLKSTSPSQGNVPRQAYIGRNVYAHATSKHQTKRGGLVMIGKEHFTNKKGGNLDLIIADKSTYKDKLTPALSIASVKRGDIRKDGPDLTKAIKKYTPPQN